jgi:pilus assembly protein Flp/PilA
MLEKIQFMTLMFINDLARKRDEINERGATAVEYGLMVSLIAGVIIVTVTALGAKLDGIFAGVTGKLK